MGNFGRVIWKLCQLGILVLLVGLGVLMVLKPAEAEDEKELVGERSEKADERGLVSKLRELFRGDGRDVHTKTGSSASEGKSSSELAVS